jgi:hypothetical protein
MFLKKRRFFYEAPEDGTGDDGNPPGTTGAPEEQGPTDAEKRLLAMEETLKKMQSNFDRKNTDYQKLMKENEELKKAQMKEDERREYEKEQHKKELEQRELAIKEREFQLEKANIINEKGISKELGSMITGDTPEDYKKNIESVVLQIEEEVKKRVEKTINDKLGGTPPPGDGNGNDFPQNPFSKEHFNLTKQGEIFRKDPALAQKMKAAAGK